MSDGAVCLLYLCTALYEIIGGVGLVLLVLGLVRAGWMDGWLKLAFIWVGR